MESKVAISKWFYLMMSIEMTDADAKKMATNTISINSKLLYLCIILGIIQTIMMNDDKMVWISVYV